MIYKTQDLELAKALYCLNYEMMPIELDSEGYGTFVYAGDDELDKDVQAYRDELLHFTPQELHSASRVLRARFKDAKCNLLTV